MSHQDPWYYATPQGERIGPISYQELRALIQGGRVYRTDLVWAAHMQEWTPLERVPELAGWGRQLPPSVPAGASWQTTQEIIDTIRKLEVASGVVWSIIGGLQVLVPVLCLIVPFLSFSTEMLVLLIAGIWNIYAALSRFNRAKLVQARRASVVSSFEGITQLIVIGVVNLLFGAVIGALWVIVDFINRDKVLRNRHLFDQ
ncbi:hypothetical protein GETHLI_32570 [Geothrix limicola]|uniref:GYF domain-containing protein n=1 Tax=Geothrix limicola TaxID=2927978 RepID=A0ABQ5QIR5_9BACT|nr:DUF4339 domain-containing protein [Geothrix limicola]GLH74755.1 hypothetical protein GETHLI_32570 [Geothrix limicola]